MLNLAESEINTETVFRAASESGRVDGAIASPCVMRPKPLAVAVFGQVPTAKLNR